MSTLSIETPRLTLIAATQELVDAEISGHAALAALLAAQVPGAWPPEFNDSETLTFTRRQLEGKPEQVGWWSWYIVLKAASEAERLLIGTGGFKGRPDEKANVEVGYSVLEDFQKQGYASEAVAGLVQWAFEQQVQSVTAETLPELAASIRVLEKNDFAFAGAGSEEGVILYRKERPQKS